VKRSIAIFFLVIFSVSFTEAGQVFKFPLLIEHYIDHNEGEMKTSFLGFLKSHYVNDHQSDGDEEKDNNLPFKHSDYQLSFLSFIPPFSCEIKTQALLLNTIYPLYIQPYRLKDPLSDIFHPPRQA
jgi:hypothetical protein